MDDEVKRLSISLLEECKKVNSDLDKIMLLLEEGADPNYIDGRFSPLSLAISNDNIGMVDILVNKGASLKLHFPSFFHITINMLEYLMFRGLDVNAVVDGGTLLNYLCDDIIVNSDIIKILISGGIDVNFRDAEGMTALHMAVLQQNIDICIILLESGAIVNIKDYEGNTPLHLNCYNKDNISIDVAKLLIERGADHRITNNKGDDCITECDIRGNQKLKNFLLSCE